MSDVPKQESLLTHEFVKSTIKFEKGILNKGNSSVPKVLILSHSGEKIFLAIPELGSDGDTKRLILYMLGRELRAEHGSIREAVFIAESWMVKASTPGSDKFAPSEHPAREEAIVIAGRNEDKSCSLGAVQPFSRDKKGAPIWQEPMISISSESGYTYEGILDDFFEGAAQVTVPEMKA